MIEKTKLNKVQEYTQKLKEYIKTHDKEIDWHDEYVFKYYLGYNFTSREIIINCTTTVKYQGVIYANSVSTLQNAIEEFGAEIIKKFILEVD